MKRLGRLLLMSYLGITVALIPLARGEDQKAILRQARQSYYNLKDEGLVSFRCSVTPDWDSIDKSLKADTTGRSLLSFMEQTHFEVSVGSDGASVLSHQSNFAPPSEQIA